MADRKIFAGGEFLITDAMPDDVFTPEDFTDEHKMIYENEFNGFFDDSAKFDETIKIDFRKFSRCSYCEPYENFTKWVDEIIISPEIQGSP